MSNPFSELVQKHNLHQSWKNDSKEAYLYERLPNNKVQCALCPRRCVVAPNQVGYCKVRKNLGGRLFAQTYGKATHIAVERVETEAVHHFMPGAEILALGNVGCNLDCKYCQNWMYSQFQYTPAEEIHEYSSQQVINTALRYHIPILSWTYNDPAVWFEFVVDTARESQKHGLKNLFKSAFFLTKEAVQELCKVIDVFAISIKSIDDNYYREFTHGWLQPVLDNTELVHQSKVHYEISNLVVTGLTNSAAHYDAMIEFVLSKLSEETPLHFTRFHPDYKYMQYPKTPLEDVEQARDRARSRGVRYPYVGNAFVSRGLNTWCPYCDELLIERFGLTTYVRDALTVQGRCGKCGSTIPIRGRASPALFDVPNHCCSQIRTKRLEYQWNADYYSLHLQLDDPNGDGAAALLTRYFEDGSDPRTEQLIVQPGIRSHRVLFCRSHPSESSFTMDYPATSTLSVLRLEDRAYYPSQRYQVG